MLIEVISAVVVDVFGPGVPFNSSPFREIFSCDVSNYLAYQILFHMKDISNFPYLDEHATCVSLDALPA